MWYPESDIAGQFYMTDEKINKEKAEALIKASRTGTLFSVEKDVVAVERQLSFTRNELGVVDIKKDRVIYIVEYTNGVMNLGAAKTPAITQIKVWVDDTDKRTDNLPAWVFFTHLLHKGAIITDYMQSDAGRRFWLKRLHRALEKNLHVYYTDFNKQVWSKVVNVGDTIEKHNPWGDGEVHRQRRFIISLKDLTNVFPSKWRYMD